MKGRTQLEIQGGFYLLEKLKREGICIYSAQSLQKNVIKIEVESKDLKKVFAILRGSCYNVIKTRGKGLTALKNACVRYAALAIGAVCFLAVVLIAQTRVLKINVVGSGAYYRAEAIALLKEEGIGYLSPMPKNSAITAKILALPRVSYCSISSDGGALTVEIQVNDEQSLLKSEPLCAPVAGDVEEIIALRGIARVAVGDRVNVGDILVENSSAEGNEALVIARVTITYPVERIFQGEKEEALLSARLEFGEITDVQAERRENGWLITGKAICAVTMNLR